MMGLLMIGWLNANFLGNAPAKSISKIRQIWQSMAQNLASRFYQSQCGSNVGNYNE